MESPRAERESVHGWWPGVPAWRRCVYDLSRVSTISLTKSFTMKRYPTEVSREPIRFGCCSASWRDNKRGKAASWVKKNRLWVEARSHFSGRDRSSHDNGDANPPRCVRQCSIIIYLGTWQDLGLQCTLDTRHWKSEKSFGWNKYGRGPPESWGPES